jgi:2-polyprenyl-6-methoxyphenol hydroxylase-like FAD-dependent oxidoreductase
MAGFRTLPIHPVLAAARKPAGTTMPYAIIPRECEKCGLAKSRPSRQGLRRITKEIGRPHASEFVPVSEQYDLVIVGGGLAGSSLGQNMARAGAKVLILEREARFRDRVRGEGIFPWGCAEARSLGLYEDLRTRCGKEITLWRRHLGAGQTADRDFTSTTPSGLGMLNFRHEAMQEVLIGLAEEAGAVVRRPAEVAGVTPGAIPEVSLSNGERITARLVVGADGRASRVRNWGGFTVMRDPDFLIIASTVHGGLGAPDDAIQSSMSIEYGQSMLVYPLGGGRHRSYLIHRASDRPRRFSGARDAVAFLASCRQMGMPAEWFASAEQDGLLASFDSSASWVEHPARDGLVLIGDAAGSSDPTYGSGLALALRDVRLLRDQLLSQPNWKIAADRYAEAHDENFSALKRITDWFTDMSFSIGPAADAMRARSTPLRAAEPSRNPDLHGSGPDAPSDEHARMRFYGLI